MIPLPGLDDARLPGGVEWERERRGIREGVPVSAKHADALQRLADDYGINPVI